jgi:hypothetical protein
LKIYSPEDSEEDVDPEVDAAARDEENSQGRNWWLLVCGSCHFPAWEAGERVDHVGSFLRGDFRRKHKAVSAHLLNNVMTIKQSIEQVPAMVVICRFGTLLRFGGSFELGCRQKTEEEDCEEEKEDINRDVVIGRGVNAFHGQSNSCRAESWLWQFIRCGNVDRGC